MMNTEYRGLRRLRDSDAEPMLEWMHDDRVNRYFPRDFAGMTKAQAAEFIAGSFTEEDRSFAIANADDEYLGTVSLKHISRRDRHAELAIATCHAAWGTGVAEAAVRDILRYAFYELNLGRVYLNVLDDNRRANRFYEKLGFQFEGCFRRHLWVRGELRDLNWYAMSKERFEELTT
jgi:diamine N-acetyltransferase